jgi:hypothetical protein
VWATITARRALGYTPQIPPVPKTRTPLIPMGGVFCMQADEAFDIVGFTRIGEFSRVAEAAAFACADAEMPRLVGTRRAALEHSETECLCCFEIDHKLELRRRLRALQDFMLMSTAPRRKRSGSVLYDITPPASTNCRSIEKLGKRYWPDQYRPGEEDALKVESVRPLLAPLSRTQSRSSGPRAIAKGRD